MILKKEKNYTVKQIAIGLLPWTLFVVLTFVFIGAVIGWTSRSDFDNTIREQVILQVNKLKEKI